MQSINSLLQWFFLPILTSFIGGLVVYFIQKYYVVWGEFSFFGYPKVPKTCKAIYPNSPDTPHDIVTISQIGARLTGKICDSKSNECVFFYGNITRTGFISYQFKPKYSNTNDYGAGFLQLSKYRNNADGYVLYIRDDDQKIDCEMIYLEPISR